MDEERDTEVHAAYYTVRGIEWVVGCRTRAEADSIAAGYPGYFAAALAFSERMSRQHAIDCRILDSSGRPTRHPHKAPTLSEIVAAREIRAAHGVTRAS